MTSNLIVMDGSVASNLLAVASNPLATQLTLRIGALRGTYFVFYKQRPARQSQFQSRQALWIMSGYDPCTGLEKRQQFHGLRALKHF